MNCIYYWCFNFAYIIDEVQSWDNSVIIIIIIIIINKVLIKVRLNKVIAGALYIVICGWNTVKVQKVQMHCIIAMHLYLLVK